MNSQLLVVVSDIHCGSDVGLAPPQTKIRKGNIVSFGENHHQAWLWEKWQDGLAQVRQIVGKSKASLVVNGDATEGSHHRNNADLIAADIETHTAMAVECLKPLSKICQKTYVVKGTECHTLEMETLLAERLGAQARVAKDKWHISVNGCEVDAAHHMTTTSRAHLEASAMSILMSNARLNYVRCGHPVPSVFLRAHRHCGGHFTDGAGLFAVTGGWQFLTRHGHKVVTDSIPRPSLLVLDWRGKAKGALPTPHEIFFNPPKHEINSA